MPELRLDIAVDAVTRREHDHEALGYLNVPYGLQHFDGTVTVFALPDETSVAFVLDADLYLGYRDPMRLDASRRSNQSDQAVAGTNRQP